MIVGGKGKYLVVLCRREDSGAVIVIEGCGCNREGWWRGFDSLLICSYLGSMPISSNKKYKNSKLKSSCGMVLMVQGSCVTGWGDADAH